MKLLDCAPCRFCGWGKITDICFVDYSIECPDCFARGPVAETIDEAIKEWNKGTSHE